MVTSQSLIDKYIRLLMPQVVEDLLYSDSEKFLSFCNGVGSDIGVLGKLTYHFIPNTIWGLDITPASDLHDVGYSYPNFFATKDDALKYKALIDLYFYKNMKSLIDTHSIFLNKIRMIRAHTYFETVHLFGEECFMEGKIIAGEKIC